MKNKYIVIKSNGLMIISFGVGEKPTLKLLQKSVGGYIEHVDTPKAERRGIGLYCNEDFFGLDWNAVATKFINDQNDMAGAYLINGDVVIVGEQDTPDGIESTWLDDDQVDYLLKEIYRKK